MIDAEFIYRNSDVNTFNECDSHSLCEFVWLPDIDVLFCQELCNGLLLPPFEAPVIKKTKPFARNP